MAESTPLRQKVFTEDALPPLPVLSQAVKSNGFVYLSGSIGCNRDLKIVPGGVQAETRAALENLGKILKASGTSFENVIKVNIYLSNLKSDFKAMNEVYVEFFGTENPPARTCVGVAALPLDALVEIECVAALPK